MINPYQEIINLLKENKIDYKETEHEAVYTSQEAAAIRNISISQIAKSLLLKYGGDFALLVLPGNRKLDSKKVKNLLGVKEFRFAAPEEVEEKMGCQIGACYPFGNIIGLTTYLDKAVSKNKIILFNPGLHTRSIEISWSDYYSLVKPKIVDISKMD